MQITDLPPEILHYAALQHGDVATLGALRSSNAAFRDLGINHAANQNVAQALQAVRHSSDAAVELFVTLARQKKLATLTHLDLSKLSLGDAAALQILQVLNENCTSLRYLNLAENGLSNAVLPALTHVENADEKQLGIAATLTFLFLGGNRLGRLKNAPNAPESAMRLPHKLAYLDLSNNQPDWILDRDWMQLASHNAALRHINLRFSALEMGLGGSILECFPENLHSADLNYCKAFSQPSSGGSGLFNYASCGYFLEYYTKGNAYALQGPIPLPTTATVHVTGDAEYGSKYFFQTFNPRSQVSTKKPSLAHDVRKLWQTQGCDGFTGNDGYQASFVVEGLSVAAGFVAAQLLPARLPACLLGVATHFLANRGLKAFILFPKANFAVSSVTRPMYQQSVRRLAQTYSEAQLPLDLFATKTAFNASQQALSQERKKFAAMGQGLWQLKAKLAAQMALHWHGDSATVAAGLSLTAAAVARLLPLPIPQFVTASVVYGAALAAFAYDVDHDYLSLPIIDMPILARLDEHSEDMMRNSFDSDEFFDQIRLAADKLSARVAQL